MTIAADSASFACPACRKNILVSSIKGQEFHNRIERPTAFTCPKCESAIIFSSRSKILFQLGVVLALFVGLPLILLTSKKDIPIAVMVFGLLLLCAGLLSQKLVLVDPLDGLGVPRKIKLRTRFLSLFGIRPKKAPAQVVDGPEGRKIGLHVLSDFGDTHTFVAEAPNRRIIVSTIRALDWETGFHQIILVKEPGVSLEVGGSLNPDDGLSAVYTDEKRNVCKVTSSPPETVEDMVSLLVSFLTGGGRWEQMYDFR